MTRLWLHDIKKLTHLKHQVDQLVANHGDAEIEIEATGYGRICLDVLVEKALEADV